MVWEKNPNQNYSGQTSYDLYTTASDGEKRLYLGFSALPSNLRNYAIEKAQLQISFSNPYRVLRISLYDIFGSWDSQSITWANAPQGELADDDSGSIEDDERVFLVPRSEGRLQRLAKRVKTASVYITASGDQLIPGAWTADVSSAKLIVTYDPDDTVTSQLNASSLNGKYVNPRIPNSMTWTLSQFGSFYSYNSVDGFTQASAVWYWRNGTSGSYTAINITGSTQRVTIPANTLPVSGTMQYYVKCTDTAGTTNTSPVYTFSTADALISATPSAPIGTVEAGSGPIVFRWTVSSPNGTAPTGADLQYSTDGSTWSSLASVSGAALQYTEAGGTIPAGQIYWRVRAYNADGSAGAWSGSAAFINVAAPNAPSVDTDGAPFATISWQSADQQAWRLTIDGKRYGPFFGTDKSFTLPDYLPDGEHVASVEVQGQYGLWSQPGTITFNVTNVPGDGIVLQGSFGVDAALTWITESATADFLIYRDGVRIGHTDGLSFMDRLVLGEHRWRVINRLPDGNYTSSNEISGTLRCCTTQVAPAEGGEWLPLKLSENSMDEQIFNWSRMHSLRHFAGAEFPVLETSPYADLSGTYDTAFACLKQAQDFEALRGRVVILKSRGGNVLIGALTEIRKRAGTFSLAYEFTVRRCHWEDFVDDTDG